LGNIDARDVDAESNFNSRLGVRSRHAKIRSGPEYQDHKCEANDRRYRDCKREADARRIARFMRVHILHHASEAPAFGLEMIEELRRHGYSKGGGERPLTANFHNGIRCRLMAEAV
jgi:hypothetical protein